jgi:Rha family phage regulatory protein
VVGAVPILPTPSGDSSGETLFYGWNVMNIIKFDEKQTMSSLEIAEYTGKNHADVLRDIRKMLIDLGLGESSFAGSYFSEQNKELPCFALPKREFLILVSGYSTELRSRIIDRWQALETELALRIVEEASRIKARQAAALQAPEMTDALKDIRQEAGKETASHHYSNEYDMINRIVLGEKAKDYRNTHDIPPCDALRDHLSFEQIRLIELAQRLNEDLILDGDSFESRKNRIKSRIEREKKSPRKARKSLK